MQSRHANTFSLFREYCKLCSRLIGNFLFSSSWQSLPGLDTCLGFRLVFLRYCKRSDLVWICFCGRISPIEVLSSFSGGDAFPFVSSWWSLMVLNTCLGFRLVFLRCCKRSDLVWICFCGKASPIAVKSYAQFLKENDKVVEKGLTLSHLFLLC